MQPGSDDLVEVRPEISVEDAQKLDLMCDALQDVVTRRNAAKLVIHFGAQHLDEVLYWYGNLAQGKVEKRPPHEPKGGKMLQSKRSK